MTDDVDGQGDMLGGGNVAKLEDGDILASLSAWARVFGIERETLRRRLVDAGVRSKGERGGHPVYGGRGVVTAWLHGPEARVDPDSLTPFQRRAWYQGEVGKLDLQERRGELVPADDVFERYSNRNKLIIQYLQTAVDVIERDVGLRPKQAQKLEEHIDRLRMELHRMLSEQEPAKPASRGAPREPRKMPSASALDEAAAFLRGALADGARPTAELVAAAKDAGISEGTLRRAKAGVGVVAKRDGRAWSWQLPPRKR